MQDTKTNTVSKIIESTHKAEIVEVKKHAGGRPTNYKPEYCNSERYFRLCKEDHTLPTICGFAVLLGTTEKVLNRWASKYTEFRLVLNDILTRQKVQLFDKGLKGLYNPTIAKLLLASNHGMSDKVDMTSGGRSLASPTMVIHEPKQITSEVVEKE